MIRYAWHIYGKLAKLAVFLVLTYTLATALLRKQFVGPGTFQAGLELNEVAGPAGLYLMKLKLGHCCCRPLALGVCAGLSKWLCNQFGQSLQKYLLRRKIFLAEKNIFLAEKYISCGKNIFLAEKNIFLAEKNIFLAEKNIFCGKKYFLRKKIFFAEKNIFLAEKNLFLAEKNIFLAEKNIFLAEKNISCGKKIFLAEKYFLYHVTNKLP